MLGKSSFLVQDPTCICSANGEGVWLVQKNGSSPDSFNVAAHITSKGTLAGKAFPLYPPIVPKSIAQDTTGRVYVADGGQADTVRVYSGKGKMLAPVTDTIFTSKWTQDRRLYGLTAVGVSSSGIVSVGSSVPGGGVDIIQVGKTGTEIQRYSSVAEANPVAISSNQSRTDLFTGNAHFKLGLSFRPKIVSSSINPFRYPNDFRVHLPPGDLSQPLIRTIQGHRFLVLPNLGGETLCIYRYDSEMAIPSVIFARAEIRDRLWQPPFQPAGTRWMWRDTNGDGQMDEGEYLYVGDCADPPGTSWTMDEAGDIWEISPLVKQNVRRWHLVEMDKKGNPVYKRSQSTLQTPPDSLSKVTDLIYSAGTDTMFMIGTPPSPNGGSIASQPDRQLISVIPDWFRGNRKPKTTIGTGLSETIGIPLIWAVAADRLFLMNGDAINVFNCTTGEKTGTINLATMEPKPRSISAEKLGSDTVILSLNVAGVMPKITYKLK